MPNELAVTAIGADRPGIIARVTAVLRDRGGNLEDASMTILGGQFAIMLLVAADTAPEALEAALQEATDDLGLVVTVREVGPGAAHRPATHVLSVYGSDRPGMVAEVSAILAEEQINVTDLTTRVLEGEQPVYAMMLEIALEDADAAERVLDAVLERVDGIDASLHPIEVETF